jgi:Kef-type K+ transport system membrane component KefB
MTNAQLSVAFFLQMFVILGTARGVGWLAQRVGQPRVVGEMIAGVVLGSVFTFVGFIAFAIVSAVFQVSASFKLGG